MSNLDYLSDKTANFKLMNDIKAWWRRRGVIVRVWLERVGDPQGSGQIYVIRSNIVQNVATARSGLVVE